MIYLNFSLADAANDPKNSALLRKAFRHFRLRQGYEAIFLSLVGLRLEIGPQSVYHEQTELAKKFLRKAKFHEMYYHGILSGMAYRYRQRSE